MSRNSSARVTPSSSNSSTSYLPQNRNTTTGGRQVGTAGSLLQERLRERDAERRRSIHFGDGGSLGSPARSLQEHNDRRASLNGVGVKGMGVKQWEEQTSSLHKQNYNLKLELFHRRDRQSKLESELAAAQKIIEEQAEYQEMNDILMVELERRDQAVDEAINLITSLEEQVELLRKENERLRNYPSSLEDQNLHSRSIPRMPSFLSDQSGETEALRSLYTKRVGASESTLSKLEEEEEEGIQEEMDSPRLSVLSRLSESSFISVYGDKNALNDHFSLDRENTPDENTTSAWVEENVTENSTTQRISPQSTKNFQQSSPDLLRPYNLEGHKKTSSLKSVGLIVNTQNHLNANRNSRGYEDSPALPPTPDTCRTEKLRGDPQKPNELFSQPGRAQATYPINRTPDLPMRPRSACETVLSRHDGYGWNTPTETDTGSINSTEDESFPHTRLRRIKTPTLFKFSQSEWGREVLSDHESALSDQFLVRRASESQEIISEDDTQHNVKTQNVDTPSVISPKSSEPNVISDPASSLQLVPARRSQTLARDTMNPPIRQVSVASAVASSVVSAVANNPSPVWRRNPISLTLARFRRHDSSNTNSHTASKTKPIVKTQVLQLERTSGTDDATPPPILRYREVTPSHRPVSASSVNVSRPDVVKDVMQEKREERQRRMSGCITTNALSREFQCGGVERDEEDGVGKGMRKWLGIGSGRCNSLKRN
ncbi:BgtA-21138 [Blumeria graminis f. sp. tritici]|uniref:BgtA-21138 n=2 Tax=Blumeria graminis f. sp. tritici TaxID=62690 RepID=A0A9X9MEX7_BLUGR|nr:hypothetical protein BGT96224_A21138 [Blumeria graminis f. sp. tritici 96224]VDB83933.1 BgtA-21138 [Blumeria graminis f. sp. tritici]